MLASQFTIAQKEYEKITRAAVETYPGEACGVLLGRNGETVISEAVICGNEETSDLSGRNYLISSKALLIIESEAAEKGLDVIGIFHSHPDKEAVLSGKDKDHMIPGLIYPVISVTSRGVSSVRGYAAGLSGEINEMHIRVN